MSKRSRSPSQSSEESESKQPETTLQDEVLPPEKRARLNDFDKEQETRRKIIKEIKTLRICNPNLKTGVTAKLDQELSDMTDEELLSLRENYHLELSQAKPFGTAIATTTAVGSAIERLLGTQGFVQVLQQDTEFIANLEMALPFSLGQYGPSVRAATLFLSHLLNFQTGWPAPVPPPPMQPPTSNTPVES